WFSIVALLAIAVLMRVGAWYKAHRKAREKSGALHERHSGLPSRKIALAMAVLIAIVFSKYFYLASLVSYYTFFLISKFHVSVRTAKIYLFIFLGAVEAGTIIGDP